MNIKSPYTNRPVMPKVKVPEPNVFDISHLISKMAELDDKIKSVVLLKEQMVSEHQTKLKEVDSKLKEHLTEAKQVLDEKVSEVDSTIEDVLKREPVVGVHFAQPKDAPLVDEKALAERIRSSIPLPQDGITPIIDYKKVAKLAAGYIPKPEDGKTPSHQEIVDKVFEELNKGKKKFSIKHIGDFTDGLEQTIRPIRSLMAGFRGGGDVVTAGSGVTITTNADGKKVITSTGGATFVENEVVSGSGTSWTLAGTPIAGSVKVYALGQRLKLTTDYTISSGNITTISSWNSGELQADYRT